MHECNAMQHLETKEKKKQKPKNKEQWSQRKNNNEAQGPCQKDSVSFSLLHPKIFRCTSSIGVCIHIRVISNSKIGIKVECLYQFTNKCYRILCLRHWHFQFVYSLSSLQLVTIRMNVSRLPIKMTHQVGLPCILSLEKVDSLSLDSFRSTLIFLDGETSMGLTTLLTGGLTVSLTASLTEGSEEDKGTKCMEWRADTKMLSTKPNPDFSEGDF